MFCMLCGNKVEKTDEGILVDKIVYVKYICTACPASMLWHEATTEELEGL